MEAANKRYLLFPLVFDHVSYSFPGLDTNVDGWKQGDGEGNGWHGSWKTGNGTGLGQHGHLSGGGRGYGWSNKHGHGIGGEDNGGGYSDD